MANIQLTGSIVQNGTDTPTRVGQRVETEEDIKNIGTPYRGMIIYIADQDSFVYVKTLKSKEIIPGVQVDQALVDEYVPLQTGGTVTLNWNDVV